MAKQKRTSGGLIGIMVLSLIGVFIGTKLLGKGQAVSKLVLRFVDFKPKGFELSQLVLPGKIVFEVYNPSRELLSVDRLLGSLTLKATDIGEVTANVPLTIQPYGRSTMELPVRLRIGALGPIIVKKIVDLLKKGKKTTLGNVEFNGFVTIEGSQIPVKTQFPLSF